MVRIGCDLDGVIFDFVGEFLRRWNTDHGTCFVEEDITDYSMSVSLGISDDYFREWYGREVAEGELLRSLPPYPDAEQFLGRLTSLRCDGWEYPFVPIELVFITSRPLPDSISDTVSSLAQVCQFVKEIHFCEKKWLVDCDIYIDDNPALLPKLNKLNKPLCIPKRPWTQHILGTMTFEEILAYINQKMQEVYLYV